MLKRTILHLRSSRSLAGPERHLLELAPALAGRGLAVEVAVLYRRRPGEPEEHPLVAELVRVGVPAFQIADPDRAGRAAGRALARRLERGDVAALHGHDPKSDWLIARARFPRAGRRALEASRAGETPLRRFATLHLHTRETPALRLYRRIDLALVRRFDGVVAVAAAAAAGLGPDTRSGGPLRRVIANGIDAERLRARAAAAGLARGDGETGRRGEAEEADPLIVAAGRLVRQKGFDLLLDALPALVAERPRLRLLLAGEGPERAALTARIARLGLGGNVELPGERPDLAALFAAADLVVLPSRSEGSPYVLLEALALGRPVVAAAVGDVAETCGSDASAVVVPPGDPAALAEAMLRLLRTPEETAARSARLCERVTRLRSAEAMAERTAAFYAEVLG